MSSTSDPTIASPRQTPLHFAGTPRHHGLPRELAEKACKRFGMMALIYAAVHVVYLLLPDIAVTSKAYPKTMSYAFIAISLAVVAFVRFVKIDPYRLIDIALAFEVLGAFGIEMNLLWWPGGWWEGARTIYVTGISWTCVWIVSFPLLVPSSPGKVALAALLSASIRPILLLNAFAHGAPQPTGPEALLWVAPNFMCVGIAIVSAFVMYGIGQTMSKAQQLGSYRLVERLGMGGMGEVWRAKHQMLARPAAVKLIRTDGGRGSSEATDHMVRRFEREAQATASLQSPHTVSLYDFGVSRDGTFYYVMELLQGLDLRELVERFGPLPAGRVIYLLRQACLSLAEAHDVGLVHRDIKPANLYVCRLGLAHDFVKVLDFGLVKRSDSIQQTALTVENVTAGTPQFMAPEVALGKPAGPSSDLYALGCTAYWSLTGQTVFEGSNPMQVVVDHIRTPPTPPSQRTELDIPRDLDDIVMACLSKEPAQRPASAEALRARLKQADVAGVWTEAEAMHWWRVHLPQLASPDRGTATAS